MQQVPYPTLSSRPWPTQFSILSVILLYGFHIVRQRKLMSPSTLRYHPKFLPPSPLLTFYRSSFPVCLSSFFSHFSPYSPYCVLLSLLSEPTTSSKTLSNFSQGKARMATVGNIVFSFIMMSVSLILIVESIRSIASHNSSDDSDLTTFHVPAIVAVAVAFFVKLGLFLYCWGLRQYSQVRILWEDHRNDLFINGFGIMTSVLGSKIVWWIDPMGATILAILIIGLWGHTAYRIVPSCLFYLWRV